MKLASERPKPWYKSNQPILCALCGFACACLRAKAPQLCVGFVLWVAVMALSLTVCDQQTPTPQHVQTGLDVLVENRFDLLHGKRVGVITNHTGLTRDGRHLVDLLAQAPNVTLTAIFGPEHGVRGSAPAGAKVSTRRDSVTGVVVYSLYGKTRQPTAEMLANLDVLVFDIQDVGARFYTYIYTMALSMEAAAQHGKTFVVLDRPNPITGRHVEGPMLQPGFESFVGLFPLPVRHGLTVGELAQMFKSERWIAGADSLDLRVVKMTGWRRDFWLDQTDVPWVAPSPSMRTLATATVYPGTCFIEGTNVSEGRGTPYPFEQIGAPWIDGEDLAGALNALRLPGVTFEPVTFTPMAQPPSVLHPKFRDQTCSGVFLRVTDRDAFRPVRTGVALVWTIRNRYPRHFQWRPGIDRLYGSDRLRNAVDAGKPLAEIVARLDEETRSFLALRSRYLLYPP